MKKESFTSANAMPVKLLQNDDLVRACTKGRIPPIHPQLIPTNVCNLKCGFCSCAHRNPKAQLSLQTVVSVLSQLASIGARAVTITGGGEPLCHPEINQILHAAKDLGLEIGLVTNGARLNVLAPSAAAALRWCRVSCSDEANRVGMWLATAKRHASIDWALSYVLTSSPDWENLAAHIRIASEISCTHVRVVTDLLNIGDVPIMDVARHEMEKRGADLPLVIYQGRKEFEHGHRHCRIGLLKPLIGADGYIYPCCGVQYASEEQHLDLPEAWRLGHISDLQRIYLDQSPFDGSVCARCYYGDYNRALEIMGKKLEHELFV